MKRDLKDAEGDVLVWAGSERPIRSLEREAGTAPRSYTGPPISEHAYYWSQEDDAAVCLS